MSGAIFPGFRNASLKMGPLFAPGGGQFGRPKTLILSFTLGIGSFLLGMTSITPVASSSKYTLVYALSFLLT